MNKRTTVCSRAEPAVLQSSPCLDESQARPIMKNIPKQKQKQTQAFFFFFFFPRTERHRLDKTRLCCIYENKRKAADTASSNQTRRQTY